MKTELTEIQRTRLIREGIVRHIEKNQYLFRIRESVDSIYIVLSGYAVLVRESEDHGIRNIFLVSEGDIANEVILDYKSASISCRAVSNMTVLCITRDRFLKLMEEDRSLNKYVIDSMAKKIRRLYHQVESSTRPTKLGHQVASRLWKFCRDYGVEQDGVIEIPFEIRITLLAGFVGSNRETVSRIVKRMTEQKILTIKNGTCRVFDITALKNFEKNE